MKRILIAMLAIVMLASCTQGYVATVGNKKITQGEFEFYLSSIKEQMKGTELQTDEDWETQEIEGEKAIDVAKQRALDIAIKNVEYGVVSELAGLTLSAEEEAQADDTKKRIVLSNGGDAGYKKYLKEMGITDKFIDMMCSSTIYYNKIAGYVEEKYPITEEGLKNRYETYRSGMRYMKAKHILFLTVDPQTMSPLSDIEIEAAKKRADEVFAKINAGGDFDTLMREYSQDPGLTENPDGYVFRRGTGEMMPEFEQVAASLKGDEIAMAETDYGYHIIRQGSVSFEDLRDEVKSVILDELVQDQISAWETEYNLKITRNEELLKEIK